MLIHPVQKKSERSAKIMKINDLRDLQAFQPPSTGATKFSASGGPENRTPRVFHAPTTGHSPLFQRTKPGRLHAFNITTVRWNFNQNYSHILSGGSIFVF
jgi:hypothetical protein